MYIYLSFIISIYNLSYIFFVHLSIDWNLGWFHVLDIVNSTTMNRVHIILWDSYSIPWGTYPEIELLDHMLVLFLKFGEVCIPFTKLVVPIYIPARLYKGSLFSTCVVSFVISFVFRMAVLVGVRCYIIMVFILIFLMISGAETLLCSFCSFEYLFWKNVCLGPSPIF